MKPTSYRVIVIGHEDGPKLGSLTAFDDVEPLSVTSFLISDDGLLANDAILGAHLRKACTSIAENRSFSAAQIALNKLCVSGMFENYPNEYSKPNG